MIVPGIKPFNRNIPSGVDNTVVDCEVIKSVDSVANDHQRELADRFTNVLTESVRIRTICQSEMCSRCIEKHLDGLSGSNKSQHISNDTETDKVNKEQIPTDHAQLHKLDCSHLTLDGAAEVNGATAISKNKCSFTDGATSAPLPHDCIDTSLNISSQQPTLAPVGCGHTRVAVLFSGGIDSLMIAALTDRYGQKLVYIYIYGLSKSLDGD
jgi:hypothetical protein